MNPACMVMPAFDGAFDECFDELFDIPSKQTSVKTASSIFHMSSCGHMIYQGLLKGSSFSADPLRTGIFELMRTIKTANLGDHGTY